MVAKSIESLMEPRVGIPLRQYAALLGTYLRPQMSLVTVVTVLLFSGIGLQLLNPQILRYFIDEALAGSPLERLILAASLFTVVALVQQFLSIFATYVSGRVGWTATNALRGDLARHCLSLDMSFHNEHTPGEMIERIDGDANQLGGFFSTFVIQILGNAVLLVGILVLLFREDWRAGLALTLFAAFTVFVIYRIKNVTVSHWRASREASADTLGFVEERLSGAEDIRTSAAKPYVMRRFYEFMRRWFRSEMRAAFMTSIVINTTWFLFSAGNALALGVGVYLFTNDFISIGTVFLIFHYTILLRMPMEILVHRVEELQRATASIVRIQELFETKRTVEDGKGMAFPDGALSLEFDDVTFAYTTNEAVLHGVSFQVRPGRVLGLLGRTGSGKTTITRLLFRLYDPDEGRVLLGGRDVREARTLELRDRIALVTQNVRLVHGSVRDNLTFFDPTIPDERLEDVVRHLGLSRWLDSLPDGLDTELQADGGGLSAGEAQLLAFARVFLKDPRVVVLDEASSRLDPGTEQLIERAVDKLVEGRTVIVIAHHLPTIERCDEIIILEDGRIVEQGDRKNLAADPDTHFSRLLRTGLEEALT